MAEESCTALLLGPDPPPPRLGPCSTSWIPVVRAEPVAGCAGRLVGAGRFDFVAFTSPRAPRFLALDARRSGLEGEVRSLLSKAVVGAVGPRTAREARESLGVEPVVPARHTGEDLARLALSLGVRRAAWVRGNVYNPGFESVMRGGGVELIEVEAYRVEVDWTAAERAAREAGRHDFLVLTSPLIASAVLPRLEKRPKRAVLIIGPTTLKRALDLGVESLEYCVAEEFSLDGLAACAARYVGGRGARA